MSGRAEVIDRRALCWLARRPAAPAGFAASLARATPRPWPPRRPASPACQSLRVPQRGIPPGSGRARRARHAHTRLLGGGRHPHGTDRRRCCVACSGRSRWVQLYPPQHRGLARRHPDQPGWAYQQEWQLCCTCPRIAPRPGLQVEGTNAAPYIAPEDALPTTYFGMPGMLQAPMIGTQDAACWSTRGVTEKPVEPVRLAFRRAGRGALLQPDRRSRPGPSGMPRDRTWMSMRFGIADGSVITYERL